MQRKRQDAAYCDAELERQRQKRATGGGRKRHKGLACQSNDPEAEQRLRASGVCCFCATVQCGNMYIDGYIAGWPAERLQRYMRWTGSMEREYGVLSWAPRLNQAQQKRWVDARQRLREAAAAEERDQLVRELLAAPRATECDACARRRLTSERGEPQPPVALRPPPPQPRVCTSVQVHEVEYANDLAMLRDEISDDDADDDADDDDLSGSAYWWMANY